jgi:hypothetical protein
MEARLLSALGGIAGIAGIGMGVFFLLMYSGNIRSTISLQGSPGLLGAYMILSFGGAATGIVAWLIAQTTKPTKPISHISLLLLVVVILTIIVAAVVVLVSFKPIPAVTSQNRPNTSITPPPPAIPTRPLEGTWDVFMSCPDGSSLREPAAAFRQGTYTRNFKNGAISGTTKLALSYVSDATVKLSGFVDFDQAGNYIVDAMGRKQDGSFNGTGQFGSFHNCELTITPR